MGLKAGEIGVDLLLNLGPFKTGLTTSLGNARSFGKGLEAIFKGAGTGLGSASKGFGAGLNSAIRGTTAPIRAMGGALNQAAKGFGAGLAANTKAVANAAASVAKAGVSSPAQMLRAQAQAAAAAQRAQGANAAAQVRAQAQARASLIRAQQVAPAQAQATVMRAQAAQHAAAVRAQGSAAAQMVRAQGSAAAQMVAAQGQRSEARMRAMMSAIRGMGGMPGRFGAGAMSGITGMPLPTTAHQLGFMAGRAARGGVEFTAGLMADAAKVAMDLESQWANLRRVLDGDDAAFARVQDRIRSIGSTMPGSNLDELLGIASMGARMGIKSEGLGSFTKTIAEMGLAIDGLPIQEATERLSRLLNVFGKGPQDARKFASALVGLDQASTASARDILDISTRAAPMAKFAGVAPQELMAIAAALRDVGVNSETAGTSLSQIFGQMPSKSGAFAKIAGVGRRDFDEMRHRSPTEALAAVGRGLAGMDQDTAVKRMNDLGLHGQRARQVLLGLAAAQGRLASFTGLANEELRTEAAINRAVEIRGNTAGAGLAVMYNNVKLLAESLGVGLLPILKAAAKGFSELARDVRASLDSNKGRIAAWGESVGKVFDTVAVAFRAWPTIVELAQVTFTDFFKRLGQSAMEAGGQLWGNLKAGFSNFAAFINNLGEHIGKVLSVSINNALADLTKDAAFMKVLGLIPGGKALAKGLGAMGLKHKDMPAFDPGKDQQAMPGFNAFQIAAPFLAPRDPRIVGLRKKLDDAKKQQQDDRARAADDEAREDQMARNQARAKRAARGAMRTLGFGAPFRPRNMPAEAEAGRKELDAGAKERAKAEAQTDEAMNELKKSLDTNTEQLAGILRVMSLGGAMG